MSLAPDPARKARVGASITEHLEGYASAKDHHLIAAFLWDLLAGYWVCSSTNVSSAGTHHGGKEKGGGQWFYLNEGTWHATKFVGAKGALEMAAYVRSEEFNEEFSSYKSRKLNGLDSLGPEEVRSTT